MKKPEIAMLETLAEIAKDHTEDIVLCGGMAVFAHYYHKGALVSPVFTEDADLLLNRKVMSQGKLSPIDSKPLSEILKAHGYEAVPTVHPIGNELHWEKWQNEDSEFHIEFLTDDHQKERHEISGVVAQGLSYFSMSLTNFSKVRLPSGTILKVASPEACILHKALTYNRRLRKEKKHKDLYYISYITLVLFEDIERMFNAVCSLRAHPKWISKGIANMANISDSLDQWIDLIIVQDSEGLLNKENVKEVFEGFKNFHKNRK